MNARALAALALAALAPLPARAQDYLYHPVEEAPPVVVPPNTPVPPPPVLAEPGNAPHPVAPQGPASALGVELSAVEVRARAVADADAEGSLGWGLASAGAACGAGCIALVLVGASATVPVLPCLAATALATGALSGAAALSPTEPEAARLLGLGPGLQDAYRDAYANELRFNRVRAAFVGGGVVVVVAALVMGGAVLANR